jgi:hypothetical protein
VLICNNDDNDEDVVDIDGVDEGVDGGVDEVFMRVVLYEGDDEGVDEGFEEGVDNNEGGAAALDPVHLPELLLHALS